MTPIMQLRTVRMALDTRTAQTMLLKERLTPMTLPACMLVTTNT